MNRFNILRIFAFIVIIACFCFGVWAVVTVLNCGNTASANSLLITWSNTATEPVTFTIVLAGRDTTLCIPIQNIQYLDSTFCAAGFIYNIPVGIATYSDSLYDWQYVRAYIIATDSAGNASPPSPPVMFWDRRRRNAD